VVRTRVGYTGGKNDAPTYADLGEHSEAIQIDYDPTVISYDELLAVFWSSHSPTSPPWSSQYKSAVFAHDAKQRAAIRASLKAEEKRRNATIHTEIRNLDRFWRAEDYHQKHRLRGNAKWTKAFDGAYDSDREFVDSTAAMRVNAFLGGKLTSLDLQEELVRLDSAQEKRAELIAASGG